MKNTKKRGRPRNDEQLIVVPPTKLQVQNILFQLRQGRFLEHAALLCGVKSRTLTQWIKLGRKNVPGYVEFTDAIDQADSELGDKLMGGIMDAVESGDAATLKWLYEKRFGQREKHMQSKWLEEQDDAEQALEENTDVLPLDEAEKQLEVMLQGSEGELQ